MQVLIGIARRVGRRFLSSIPALFGVMVITFVLMRVLPGDPAVFFASGPNAGQQEIDELRHKMGLDEPMPLQLVHYMADITTGGAAPFGTCCSCSAAISSPRWRLWASPW